MRLLPLAALLLAPAAQADTELLAVSYAGEVFRVDAATGAGALVGASGFTALNATAPAPAGGTYAVSSPAGFPPTVLPAELILLDPATGAGSSLGSFLTSGTVRAAATAPDGALLLAVKPVVPPSQPEPQSELWRLDPATLDVQLVGAPGLFGLQALTFTPDGALYGYDVAHLDDQGAPQPGAGLVTLDPATGSATDVDPGTSSAPGFFGLQFLTADLDGRLVGGRDQLYELDRETGALTAIGGGGYADLRGGERLPPAAPTVYCEPKPSSAGCVPRIDYAGAPSATDPTPFRITADDVLPNQGGLLFYGFEPAAQPFQGGLLCARPPLRRTPAQTSGGSAPLESCSGAFELDFNAWIQSGVDPSLVAGRPVYAQYWMRDPGAPSGTGLSDALAFVIGP
jgi:hypothetical protein